MYKQDLALYNLQWLICHKTEPNLISVCRVLYNYKLADWLVLRYVNLCRVILCRSQLDHYGLQLERYISRDLVWLWGYYSNRVYGISVAWWNPRLLRSATGLNLDFSFSMVGCHNNVKEPCLSDYPLIAGGIIVGFIPFRKKCKQLRSGIELG